MVFCDLPTALIASLTKSQARNLAMPNSRRRPLAAGLFLLYVGVLLVGCGDRSGVDKVMSPPGRVKFQLAPCHISLSAEQCEILQRGINHLRSHPDVMCRNMGARAYNRNRGGRYLYRYEYSPGATIQAWGWGPDETGSVFFSSYGYAGHGGTNIAGLTAHEEYHIMFPQDPNDDYAFEWEGLCGAGFSNTPP